MFLLSGVETLWVKAQLPSDRRLCKLGLSESRIKLIANLVCNRENKDIAS